GKVTHAASHRSATFGQLTKGQKLARTIAADVSVTPAAQWQVEGTSAPKGNGRDIVTGRPHYTSDLKRPGMLYGRVLRPASFGATLVSLDSRAAEALSGVKVVRDGDFVGVVAPDALTAARALAALRAEWKTTPQPSSRELFDYLKHNP